ncbi:hypothetical protein PVAP13_3KG301000 [Panicum virgatum]|uniref:Uncharacterized protein n=1 Tax=Panicum virgatum TaxID=38727 RepID=A0A8T0UX70_PANVG|nr:hypothetical protein PVAP13_3KG301000 [Panicum virgatum]
MHLMPSRLDGWPDQVTRDVPKWTSLTRCSEERSTAVHSHSTAAGLDHGWDHMEAAAQLHTLARRCYRARCMLSEWCWKALVWAFGQPRAHHGLTARLGGNGQWSACCWAHGPKIYSYTPRSDRWTRPNVKFISNSRASRRLDVCFSVGVREKFRVPARARGILQTCLP